MKQAKEIEVVGTMIGMYCHGKHKSKRGTLCPECAELFEFVKLKRSRCPYGDDKNFCSACPIHCYQSNPEMRQKIRAVMRYAGPRMMFTHPLLTFAHLRSTIKGKIYARKKKKEEAAQ